MYKTPRAHACVVVLTILASEYLLLKDDDPNELPGTGIGFYWLATGDAVVTNDVSARVRWF
jgi:hypothetical protein